MIERLPNGLTPEQDAAFDALAVAIAAHWLGHDYDCPHTRRVEQIVAALEHRIQPIPTTNRQEQS